MKSRNERMKVEHAYEKGEQIQFYSDICKQWIDIKNIVDWRWSLRDYRIKPKYIPFETPEEFLEAQRKHGAIIKSIEDCVLFSTYVNNLGYILLDDDKNNIAYSHINILYRRFVFTDGTPCGKEVNV